MHDVRRSALAVSKAITHAVHAARKLRVAWYLAYVPMIAITEGDSLGIIILVTIEQVVLWSGSRVVVCVCGGE